MKITQNKGVLIDHGNSNQGPLEIKNRNLKKNKFFSSQKIKCPSHSVIEIKFLMQGYTMLSGEMKTYDI